MLYVDRDKLEAAIDAFCGMAKTAAAAGAPTIATDGALANRSLISAHLLASANLILCGGVGEAIGIAPSDVSWIVGGVRDGYSIARDGVRSLNADH